MNEGAGREGGGNARGTISMMEDATRARRRRDGGQKKKKKIREKENRTDEGQKK